ncbi:Bug family tripartite tricarboxylate transporter substrate binding protein, partial [Burkholderia sola]|uniref:Bug family tripartite tricarboxylate transporter substrate binding protein n=1 Tax=Burkholderia sola TaxID=2843302 RepID=UPI00338FDF8F
MNRFTHFLSLACLALGLTLGLTPLSGHAAEFPEKPVRIVVPYTAGGGSDNIARALGTELSRELGQPVVVDNKPGASAMLGAELVARTAPDGYTLLFTTSSTHAISPHLMTRLAYK